MSKPSNRVKQKNVLPESPAKTARAIPEKCRLCAKITAQQALHLHGSEGDGCWDSSVCPSRRSHARHRERRNQTRNRKRRLEQDTVILTDSVATSVQEPINACPGIPKQLEFKTELPVVGESAILQVYRQSVDAPVHAVGGEIWLGAQKSADITPIHCMKLTPKQVEIYLERLLKKLAEVYGIRKFASMEELHPSCCPLPGCKGRS